MTDRQQPRSSCGQRMLTVFAAITVLLTGTASIALAGGRPATHANSRMVAHHKRKPKCKPRKHTKRGTHNSCPVRHPKALGKGKPAHRGAPLKKAATPTPAGATAPGSSPVITTPPSPSGGQPATNAGAGTTEVVGFGPFKELTTPTETTLEANIDPEGNDVKYHFEYGPTTSYGTNYPVPDADAGAGFGPVEVKLKVSGLMPQATYHERVVAEFAGHVYRGTDYEFTTGPYAPEPESFLWITSPTTTEITLRDNVNPGYADTTAHFEYGETTALGNDTPEMDIGAGGTRVPVEYTLHGLKPSTPYYFRLEAKNSVGTVHGLEFTRETA